VHGPCKELCSRAIFFLKSATKRPQQHKTFKLGYKKLKVGYKSQKINQHKTGRKTAFSAASSPGHKTRRLLSPVYGRKKDLAVLGFYSRSRLPNFCKLDLLKTCDYQKFYTIVGIKRPFKCPLMLVIKGRLNARVCGQ
jgi:hypothetical protein